MKGGKDGGRGPYVLGLKVTRERKGFLYSQFITERSQSRNLMQELKAESTEEHCLLACILAHSQLPFLSIPSPLTRDSIAHGGLGLSTSVPVVKTTV